MSDNLSELPPYVYDELPPGHIRLLNPVDSPAGLSWTLQSAELSQDLTYDALSYSWGSLDHLFPVNCAGKLLQVHRNLHLALPFLARRTERPRPIWVDAVCINQANYEEKMAQIKQMNRLYHRAQTVWVWLGLPEPEALPYIEKAVSLFPVIVQQEKRRKELNLQRNFRSHEVLEPLQNLEPEVWTAILYILRNTWYHRVWIVQEAALAQDLVFMCGESHIDCDSLEAAVGADEFGSYKVNDSNGEQVKLVSHSADTNVMFYIRSIVRRDVSYTFDSANMLLRMALLMDGHGCSVAQDRVLGMLGMVKGEDIDSTGMDLRAPVETLYTQFSSFLLLQNDPNETQFWWRYFNIAFTLTRTVGLPSWVPDLHSQKSKLSGHISTIDEYCKEPRVKEFQASWRKGTRRQGAHVGELVIRGKLLDRIAYIHTEIPRIERGSPDWIIKFVDWEASVSKFVSENQAMKKMYETSDPTLEPLYWRTLLADNLLFSNGTKMSAEMWEIYRNNAQAVKQLLHDVIERNAKGEKEIINEEEEATLKILTVGSQFLEILTKLALLTCRQLFITTQGRLGFGLGSIRPDDIVCIFHGASTPHVLRKVEGADGEKYRVLSDVYIHGLMHGKLDLDTDDLDAEEQDIVLV